VLITILTEQLFAAKGWRVVATRLEAQRVIVDVEATREVAICSGCGETKRRIHDIKPARTWRHTDAWSSPTFVCTAPRRVRCRRCGVRVEQVPWARTRSRFTHAFEAEILKRARDTSILGVCRQLGLHWTSVMRLIKRWVEESAERHFRSPLRHIGVDEVSYGRGHRKMLTIVWDHDRARVVWIGEGNSLASLDAFYAKLGRRRCQRLIAVTMDMWNAYIRSTRTHAPQAAIVFDRFHIERYLTNAVNLVRNQEFFRHGGARRDAMRGKKFLLLRKWRRLRSSKRRELVRLLVMNQRLFKAYVLKEQFEHAWTYTTERGMYGFLLRWRRLLNWSRLKPLIAFWNLLMRYVAGVLAWARFRLTNAALEGNNSRVRGISQRARGYRNPNNLMLVLYHASWSTQRGHHPDAR
jgi:transposase